MTISPPKRTPTQHIDRHAKPLLIGGEWHTTKRTLTSRSPATGHVLDHVCAGGANEINLAVQAAQRAFPAWRNASEGERKAVLQGLHDVLAERRREVADLISLRSAEHRHDCDAGCAGVVRQARAARSAAGTREADPAA